MSDQPLKANLLTAEQQAVVDNTFQWTEPTFLTDEEMREAVEMFKTPERFALLRRILGLYTTKELGVAIENREAQIGGGSFEELGREFAIERRAHRIIKNGLVNLFIDIQDRLKKEKTERFIDLNNKTIQANADVHTKDIGANV